MEHPQALLNAVLAQRERASNEAAESQARLTIANEQLAALTARVAELEKPKKPKKPKVKPKS